MSQMSGGSSIWGFYRSIDGRVGCLRPTAFLMAPVPLSVVISWLHKPRSSFSPLMPLFGPSLCSLRLYGGFSVCIANEVATVPGMDGVFGGWWGDGGDGAMLPQNEPCGWVRCSSSVAGAATGDAETVAWHCYLKAPHRLPHGVNEQVFSPTPILAVMMSSVWSRVHTSTRNRVNKVLASVHMYIPTSITWTLQGLYIKPKESLLAKNISKNNQKF